MGYKKETKLLKKQGWRKKLKRNSAFIYDKSNYHVLEDVRSTVKFKNIPCQRRLPISFDLANIWVDHPLAGKDFKVSC